MTILGEFTIICSCNEIKKLLDKSMYLSEGKPEKANLCILDMKLFVKFIKLKSSIFSKQPVSNWCMKLKLKSTLKKFLPSVKEQICRRPLL